VTAYDVFLADCPARTTLGLIGNTWTAVVLVALGERSMRYSELQARIGGVSKKMLTQTLKRLQDNGLARKGPTFPVAYELTELGESLLGPIGALVDWAEEHTQDLLLEEQQSRS
jgi:DNA-binding HxlR family transcriptional regulator